MGSLDKSPGTLNDISMETISRSISSRVLQSNQTAGNVPEHTCTPIVFALVVPLE